MRRENNKIMEEGIKKLRKGNCGGGGIIKMKRRGVSKTLFAA